MIPELLETSSTYFFILSYCIVFIIGSAVGEAAEADTEKYAIIAFLIALLSLGIGIGLSI